MKRKMSIKLNNVANSPHTISFDQMTMTMTLSPRVILHNQKVDSYVSYKQRIELKRKKNWNASKRMNRNIAYWTYLMKQNGAKIINKLHDPWTAKRACEKSFGIHAMVKTKICSAGLWHLQRYTDATDSRNHLMHISQLRCGNDAAWYVERSGVWKKINVLIFSLCSRPLLRHCRIVYAQELVAHA